jgi:hypothetical protein
MLLERIRCRNLASGQVSPIDQAAEQRPGWSSQPVYGGRNYVTPLLTNIEIIGVEGHCRERL